MNWFIAFVSIVLLLQVLLFFMIRAKRRKEKENNVLEKYNIRSSADAFRLINDPNTPDGDREKIEKLYVGDQQDPVSEKAQSDSKEE